MLCGMQCLKSLEEQQERFFGESKGYQLQAIEGWWWKGKVQKLIKEKCSRFTTWQKDKK